MFALPQKKFRKVFVKIYFFSFNMNIPNFNDIFARVIIEKNLVYISRLYAIVDIVYVTKLSV